MARETNIQVLFSAIQPTHVADYLKGSGWKVSEDKDLQRLNFEGPLHDGGEPYRLFVSTRLTARRYRTNLQRAVYALSAIEEREPIEICHDMLDAAPTTSGHSSSPRHLQLANESSGVIQFRLGTSTVILQPNESIALHVTTDPASDLGLVIPGEHCETWLGTPCRIAIRTSNP